jgi:hypothetical protein
MRATDEGPVESAASVARGIAVVAGFVLLVGDL